MPDPVISDRLYLIEESIGLIESRMKNIKASSDFVKDETGKLIMDAICMRLQFIGECLRKIDKMDESFLPANGIDSTPVIRFRDFIAHHYEKTDYEIIYDTCTVHLPELKRMVLDALKKN